MASGTPKRSSSWPAGRPRPTSANAPWACRHRGRRRRSPRVPWETSAGGSRPPSDPQSHAARHAKHGLALCTELHRASWPSKHAVRWSPCRWMEEGANNLRRRATPDTSPARHDLRHQPRPENHEQVRIEARSPQFVLVPSDAIRQVRGAAAAPRLTCWRRGSTPAHYTHSPLPAMHLGTDDACRAHIKGSHYGTLEEKIVRTPAGAPAQVELRGRR